MAIFDSNESAKLKCKFGILNPTYRTSDSKIVTFAPDAYDEPKTPGIEKQKTDRASNNRNKESPNGRMSINNLVISEMASEESLESEGESVSDKDSISRSKSRDSKKAVSRGATVNIASNTKKPTLVKK